MLVLRHSIRRITICSGVLLLFLAGAWLMVTITKKIDPTLTRDNVRQIKAGMTQLEVQDLVGAPPSFSAKGPETTKGMARWAPAQVKWITAQGWINDDAELTVLFDEEGKVVDRRYYTGGPPVPPLARLRNQVRYYLRW